MIQYTATPDYYRDYICHDFYNINDINDDEYLEHYGVPGMRWGHRKQRVLVGRGGKHRFMSKVYGINERYYAKKGNKSMAAANRRARQNLTKTTNKPVSTKKHLTDQQKQRLKKVAIGAGIAAGTAAAAYGGYKLNKAAIKRAKWNDEVSMLRNLERAKNATDVNMKKRYEDLADIYRKRKAAGKYSARHKVRMLLYNE